MKTILFTLLFGLAFHFTLSGQQFNYLPDSIPGHQIIVYEQFTLSYNEQYEQADWVAYELTKKEVKQHQPRSNYFCKDANVISESASRKDYRFTGFDLGHLSPAADNNLSPVANKQSFLMSNISPQLPGFNRGIWKKLEKWVRQKAKKYDTVYVITGPVFIGILGSIGDDSVAIPAYFYKVLLRKQGNHYYSIGFLIPQIGARGKLSDYVVPVNAVETLTGIDFFPALPDNKENKTEAQFQVGKWGL